MHFAILTDMDSGVQQAVDGLVEKGWTYAALADALKVTWYSVRRWHRGEHAPHTPWPVLQLLRGLDGSKVPKKRRRRKH